jgi:hypothetical protein
MNSRLPAFLVLVILGLGSAQAAPTGASDKFSEFEGRFKGIASFLLTTSGPAFPGSGTIKARALKKGKVLRLVFAGTISLGGVSFPYSNVFTINRSGAYTIADGVFGLPIGSPGAVAGGTLIKKKAILGNGAFQVQGTASSFTFSIRSKTHGKTRTLTVDYVISNENGTFPIHFVAAGKI